MEDNRAATGRQPASLPKEPHIFSIMYSLKPDIYLVNSFRITGLAVDSSARDITKQGERLKLMHKLDDAPVKIPGILPVELEKDYHELREAAQRLHDPDKRLLDEIFWFWPETFGKSSEDAALQAVSRKDRETALKVWTEREKTGDERCVATHNLAVFFHASALDLENLDRPLTTSEQMERDNLWKQSFARWRTLTDCPGFWTGLGDRIHDLDDPRLTDETAAHIRKSLPMALLSLNASLAVAAAERGDVMDVARQKRLMEASGFSDDMIKRSLRYAVSSMRDRVKLLCLNAASEMESPFAEPEKIALRLLENSRIPLQALDSVLPPGYATLDGAHDSVAERLLLLTIAMLEKDKKYQEALDLMKKAMNMARGAALRARIDRNIGIVNHNLEEQKLSRTCWFCKTNPADEASGVEVRMQGMARKESLNSWDTVDWKHATIIVPRCVLCRHRHSAPDDNLMGKALSVFTMGKFDMGRRKTRDIFPDTIDQDVETVGLEARLDFPPVKDRLSKGWTLVEERNKKK
jgi:hypothetical protein